MSDVNVKVICRFRPINEREKREGSSQSRHGRRRRLNSWGVHIDFACCFVVYDYYVSSVICVGCVVVCLFATTTLGDEFHQDIELKFPDDNRCEVTQSGREPQIFTFDRIFWDTSTTQVRTHTCVFV